jgi:hypothetical protein
VIFPQLGHKASAVSRREIIGPSGYLERPCLDIEREPFSWLTRRDCAIRSPLLRAFLVGALEAGANRWPIGPRDPFSASRLRRPITHASDVGNELPRRFRCCPYRLFDSNRPGSVAVACNDAHLSDEFGDTGPSLGDLPLRPRRGQDRDGPYGPRAVDPQTSVCQKIMVMNAEKCPLVTITTLNDSQASGSLTQDQTAWHSDSYPPNAVQRFVRP